MMGNMIWNWSSLWGPQKNWIHWISATCTYMLHVITQQVCSTELETPLPKKQKPFRRDYSNNRLSPLLRWMDGWWWPFLSNPIYIFSFFYLFNKWYSSLRKNRVQLKWFEDPPAINSDRGLFWYTLLWWFFV